mgnify:CR=1 FL=1
MTNSVTHPFVSAKSDGADATLVQPGDWNDVHTLAAALGVLGIKGADLTCAATLVPGTDGDFFDVTGATGPVTAITPSPAWAAGRDLSLKFSSTPTITHNGTSLILLGAVNFIARAGDVLHLKSLGSGNWREVGRHAYDAAQATPSLRTISTDTPAAASGAGSAGLGVNVSADDHVHPATGGTASLAAVLAADYTLTTGWALVTGMSLTLLANTTYLVLATATMYQGVNPEKCSIRIQDTTNAVTITSTEFPVISPAALNASAVSCVGRIVVGGSNVTIQLQAISLATTSTIRAATPDSGTGNNATNLVAWQA